MTDVTLPSWAAAIVCSAFGILVLYVRWSLRTLHDQQQIRLQRIEDTVHEIDRRVIRIETILDGNSSSGSNPVKSRVRVLTPPSGTPIIHTP